MVGIAASSFSILRLLFGSQWTPATPYMMLACFTFALWPFHTINLRGIMALGRSDVFLKLEIVKKSLIIVVLLSSFRLGVLPWMTISAFVIGPLGVIVNAWPNRKLLNYTISMQLRDVMPTILLCFAEAIVLLGISILMNFMRPMFAVAQEGASLMVFLSVKLILQFIFGAGVFFGLAYIFRLKPMGEYARMGAVVIRGKSPRLAAVLESRFAV